MEIDDFLKIHGEEMSKEWKMAFKYNLPYLLAIHICRRTNDFSFKLLYCNERSVYNALNACIAEEWGEGVAIVEQEIARRGLHVEDNKRRFEL